MSEEKLEETPENQDGQIKESPEPIERPDLDKKRIEIITLNDGQEARIEIPEADGVTFVPVKDKDGNLKSTIRITRKTIELKKEIPRKNAKDGQKKELEVYGRKTIVKIEAVEDIRDKDGNPMQKVENLKNVETLESKDGRINSRDIWPMIRRLDFDEMKKKIPCFKEQMEKEDARPSLLTKPDAWINDRIAKVNEELESLSIPFDYEGVSKLMDEKRRSFNAEAITQTALQLARMREPPFPTDEDFVKALALMVGGEIYASLPRSDWNPKVYSLWDVGNESEERYIVRKLAEDIKGNPDMVKLLPWNATIEGSVTTDERLIEILAPDLFDELKKQKEEKNKGKELPARCFKRWSENLRRAHCPEGLKKLGHAGGLTLNEAYFLVHWRTHREDQKERLDLSRFRVIEYETGSRILQENDDEGNWEVRSFLPDDSS